MSIYVNTNQQYVSDDYHHAFIVSPSSGNTWLQKCIYRDSNGEMCLASPNIFCNEYTSTAYPERNRLNFQPSTIRCHKDSLCLSNEGTLFMYFRTDTQPNMSDKPYIGFALYDKSSRSVVLNGNTAVLEVMSIGGTYFAASPINASDGSIYLSTMEFIKPTLTATYNGTETVAAPSGTLNAYELVLKRPSDIQRNEIPDDYNDWRPSSSYGSSFPYYSVRFIISAPSDWTQIVTRVPYLMRQSTTASIRYDCDDLRLAWVETLYYYKKKIKEKNDRSYWLVDILCPAVGNLDSVASSYFHAYIPYIGFQEPPSSGSLHIHDMQMTIRLTDSIRSSAT